MRAATLLSKVFLHHLTPLLTLSEFLPLWLTVLDLLRAYLHADTNENLSEAIPETLKNMLLVMSSAQVLVQQSNLWAPTWRAIDAFLPNLRNEIFSPPQASNVEQPPQLEKNVVNEAPAEPENEERVKEDEVVPEIQTESQEEKVKAAVIYYEPKFVPWTGQLEQYSEHLSCSQQQEMHQYRPISSLDSGDDDICENNPAEVRSDFCDTNS